MAISLLRKRPFHRHGSGDVGGIPFRLLGWQNFLHVRNGLIDLAVGLFIEDGLSFAPRDSWRPCFFSDFEFQGSEPPGDRLLLVFK